MLGLLTIVAFRGRFVGACRVTAVLIAYWFIPLVRVQGFDDQLGSINVSTWVFNSVTKPGPYRAIRYQSELVSEGKKCNLHVHVLKKFNFQCWTWEPECLNNGMHLYPMQYITIRRSKFPRRPDFDDGKAARPGTSKTNKPTKHNYKYMCI